MTAPTATTTLIPSSLTEFVHDLDQPHQMAVELVQLLRRHPQLQDRLPTRLLDRVTPQELRLDPEPGHIPDPVLRDVPVAGDLDGIVLVKDRIEDRLLRQPRRPSPPSRLLNEVKFVRA